ncbi:hypothetical protein G9A89_010045 [Geosiphon pyriformis]|nr:hypothetical protein G9A89_010045 [Geosiphon pyriformis]
MEPTSSFVGGSGSGLTGLGTQSGVRSKKCVEGVYYRGVSYKKPRKPEAAGRMVDSSAGPLSVGVLGADGVERKKSWGSDIESDSNSVSEISDMENLKNMVAEETSYMDSNVLNTNNMTNDTTLRMTRTVTYVLGQPPKPPAFDKMSDDKDAMVLLFPKFSGSKRLLAVESRVTDNKNFEPVKSFTLDIKISAVPGKTNVDKLMAVKKIFYRIDRFGGASTPSKFPGIIRSSFTSEKSLIKAREMAISEKILVNNDLRKVNSRSDRRVIIKEIPVDLPKLALVEYESSEMADLVTARWSVLMGKNSVHVAKANIDKQTWVSRDQHRALLYTLLVGINAHDLSSLLESYGGKTCYIGCNPNSYVRDRCAVICFGNKASKLAAIGTVPVFKNVNLYWAGLSLASCTRCKQFSHVMVNCSLGEYSGVRGRRVVSEQDWICLAGIYKKKSASVTRPVSFGGKTWAQVVGGSPSHMISSDLVGTGLHSGLVPSSMATVSPTVSYLNDWLAILECSLELLTDHISGILVRLESIDLVPVVTPSLSLLPVVSETLSSDVISDMILDTALVLPGTPLSVIHDAVVKLSSSSSKVFTAKVSGLETKLIALEVSIGSVLNKLNILCSGSGLSVLLSSQ